MGTDERDEPVSERPEPIGGEHGPLHNSTGLATGWVRVECDCGWQSDPVPGVLAEMSVYAEHVTDRLRARLVEAEKVVDVCRQICDTGEAITGRDNVFFYDLRAALAAYDKARSDAPA